jgi:hypothetical protein
MTEEQARVEALPGVWRDEMWREEGNERNGRDEGGEDAINPMTAGRVLLGAGIAGDLEPPDELEPGILLRGKVHSVYAGPGTGKTMFMLWAAARCVERGEAVVVLDMENGPGSSPSGCAPWAWTPNG